MPFLSKLMQDSEKVASYSFIHSLATILGQSVYEKVAKIIAEPHFPVDIISLLWSRSIAEIYLLRNQHENACGTPGLK